MLDTDALNEKKYLLRQEIEIVSLLYLFCVMNPNSFIPRAHYSFAFEPSHLQPHCKHHVFFHNLVLWLEATVSWIRLMKQSESKQQRNRNRGGEEEEKGQR